MQYKIIYADPPWTYADKCHSGKRGAGYKYQTMSVADICALPVAQIADAHCLLAMWWVNPMPHEALRVVNAWGFTLKTMQGFCWHKKTLHGKDHFGMGNWTRANAESVLFAVRGKPQRQCAGVPMIIESTIGRHSAKPDEVRDRLVRLMGDVPRIELFARNTSQGWDSWGNEVTGAQPLLPNS